MITYTYKEKILIKPSLNNTSLLSYVKTKFNWWVTAKPKKALQIKTSITLKNRSLSGFRGGGKRAASTYFRSTLVYWCWQRLIMSETLHSSSVCLGGMARLGTLQLPGTSCTHLQGLFNSLQHLAMWPGCYKSYQLWKNWMVIYCNQAENEKGRQNLGNSFSYVALSGMNGRDEVTFSTTEKSVKKAVWCLVMFPHLCHHENHLHWLLKCWFLGSALSGLGNIDAHQFLWDGECLLPPFCLLNVCKCSSVEKPNLHLKPYWYRYLPGPQLLQLQE